MPAAQRGFARDTLRLAGISGAGSSASTSSVNRACRNGGSPRRCPRLSSPGSRSPGRTPLCVSVRASPIRCSIRPGGAEDASTRARASNRQLREAPSFNRDQVRQEFAPLPSVGFPGADGGGPWDEVSRCSIARIAGREPASGRRKRLATLTADARTAASCAAKDHAAALGHRAHHPVAANLRLQKRPFTVAQNQCRHRPPHNAWHRNDLQSHSQTANL